MEFFIVLGKSFFKISLMASFSKESVCLPLFVVRLSLEGEAGPGQ